MVHQRNAGFTLAEVLITLTLTGVLAALILPTMNHDVSKDKLLNIAKTSATDIAMAYSDYLRDNTPAATITAQNVIDKTNFVRVIAPAENITLQMEDVDNRPGPAAGPFDSPCNATTPCVLMHNGAIIQYDADATFNGTTFNSNALRFIVDPDGTGPETAYTVVLFFNGRISTRTYSPMAVFDTDAGHADDLPSQIADPKYIWAWTNG